MLCNGSFRPWFPLRPGSRSGSWSLCCVSRVTPPGWCGRRPAMPGARPSASRTSSTGEGRSPTAPPSTPRTCSAWRSTNTRTSRCAGRSATELRFKIQKTAHVVSLWQGLFSSVICPGLVMTNLTYGILPSFFWTLIMPIMWLVGCSALYLFTSNFNLEPRLTTSPSRHTDPDFHQHFHAYAVQRSRGTGLYPAGVFRVHTSLRPGLRRGVNTNSCSGLSQHWLFLQKPESLDPRAKYQSLTSGLGTNYTEPRRVSNVCPRQILL